MSLDGVVVWSTRTLLQVLPPVSNPINSTAITDEFTNFSLGFAGGLALGLVLAIAAMGVGLVLAFFGCRLFKYTLFIIAFLFGAALGFFIVLKLGGSAEAGLIAAAILGLILGALAVKVWKVSLFVLGAGCGFIIWTVFKALFPNVLNTQALLYGVLIAVCIILGLVAVKMEKIWLLFGTPLVGTFLFIQGVDYFLDPHLNVFQLLDTSSNGCTFASCYVLYSAVFGGSLFGLFIQYRYTSEYGKKRRERAAMKREAKEEYAERDKHRRKYRKRDDSESEDD